MKNAKENMERGNALMIAVFLFLVVSATIVLGVIVPVTKAVQNTTNTESSKRSFFTAQAGFEDMMYRVLSSKSYENSMNFYVDGNVATTTISISSDGFDIVSEATSLNTTRKIKGHLVAGSGASFPHGSQSGEGGLILENSSSILGNVFSNGAVSGTGSNLVDGTVISAGDSGIIEGVHITGSGYSSSIVDSDIDGDAYYETISGSTVLGNLHPNSTNQEPASLPISDETIEEMKTDALSGGVLSSPCEYEITSDITIGPKKIDCDLKISGDPIVTLAGNIWVNGNIDIRNTAKIKVSQSVGDGSIAIIADKTSSPTTGGKIKVENSVTFEGSGVEGSNILLISQNTSAENGGDNVAIDISNSVDGEFLVYAGHGEIILQNNIHLKGVTAYRIRLKNSAQVEYDTGIASLLFKTGSGGGYVFNKWREIE